MTLAEIVSHVQSVCCTYLFEQNIKVVICVANMNNVDLSDWINVTVSNLLVTVIKEQSLATQKIIQTGVART